MKLSCPSKTFLCGEYGVLLGGQALVLTHEPRFQLNISHSKEKSSFPKWLHKESPAGKLYLENRSFAEDFQIEFFDPHSGGGGFGASGAQFLMLYYFFRKLKNHTEELMSGVLLKDFKRFDSSSSSGSDVLAQFIGRTANLDLAYPQNSSALFWPFKDLNLLIVPTGKKLPTHEHLENLDLSRFEVFKDLSSRIIESFESGEKEEFLNRLRDFTGELRFKNLIAEHSLQLMDQLTQISGVELVKPCGALGSDTLLLLIEKGQTSAVEAQLNEKGFRFFKAGLESDKSMGIRIESAAW